MRITNDAILVIYIYIKCLKIAYDNRGSKFACLITPYFIDSLLFCLYIYCL